MLAATIGTEALRGDAIDPEYRARSQLLRARLAESPGEPVFLVVGSSRFATWFADQHEFGFRSCV
jgi:hypothetical protein